MVKLVSQLWTGCKLRRTTQLKRLAALAFLASGGWNLYQGIMATPEGEIDSLRCWAGGVCVLAAVLIEKSRRRPQRR